MCRHGMPVREDYEKEEERTREGRRGDVRRRIPPLDCPMKMRRDKDRSSIISSNEFYVWKGIYT